MMKIVKVKIKCIHCESEEVVRDTIRMVLLDVGVKIVRRLLKKIS